jgi:hypothetical protein
LVVVNLEEDKAISSKIESIHLKINEQRSKSKSLEVEKREVSAELTAEAVQREVSAVDVVF